MYEGGGLMKKNLLIFTLGFFSFIFIADVYNTAYDVTLSSKYMPNGWDPKGNDALEKDHPVLYEVHTFFLLPTAGLFAPLAGRCKTKNGKAWWKCNKAQIAISDLVYGKGD